MVQVVDVEVGEDVVGAELVERLGAVGGEDGLVDGEVGVAGFEAEVGGLLERGDLAAGLAAELEDVGFVPRLDRVGQAPPALGEAAVEGVDVAEDQSVTNQCFGPWRFKIGASWRRLTCGRRSSRATSTW